MSIIVGWGTKHFPPFFKMLKKLLPLFQPLWRTCRARSLVLSVWKRSEATRGGSVGTLRSAADECLKWRCSEHHLPFVALCSHRQGFILCTFIPILPTRWLLRALIHSWGLVKKPKEKLKLLAIGFHNQGFIQPSNPLKTNLCFSSLFSPHQNKEVSSTSYLNWW